MAAAPDETIVYKGLPNAFAGTELDEILKGFGRKNMIAIGFMTHMCVSSTGRAGLDLGYGSAVVANACATRDLPDGARRRDFCEHSASGGIGGTCGSFR